MLFGIHVQNVTSFAGVHRVGVNAPGPDHFHCGEGPPTVARFSWPMLATLNMGHNPISSNVRDFLHSLSYVSTLRTLNASGCGLRGAVPDEVLVFATTPNYGDPPLQWHDTSRAWLSFASAA